MLGAIDAALTILLTLIILVVVLVEAGELLFTVTLSVMIVSAEGNGIGALTQSILVSFVIAMAGPMFDVSVMVTESIPLS
jgi:hypothetical protein